MKTMDANRSRVAIRVDTGGVRHEVGSAPCERCGCLYDYSLDELGIVWEAGHDVGVDCLDALCDCHVFPVLGLRCKLNLAS